MSLIIKELSTIEVDEELLMELDISSIYKSFGKNYKKLDDLKDFRSDHEKRNWLSRWWHDDQLRNAQLNSVEVQAEFSKTIGQLMMISILQSKALSEQQKRLHWQQNELKSQANDIEKHTSDLQQQHHTLSEQSKKLKDLVTEYFELKGLTEDGANRLIEIANNIKSTKDDLLHEFSVRTNVIENRYDQICAQNDAFSTDLSEKIKSFSEREEARILELRDELHDGLSQAIERLNKYHDAQTLFEKETSSRFNRLTLIVATLSTVLAVLLCGLAYMLS